jgi:uncharacterized membrane protein YeaQ/YmgE (transglycosylase-associated protein family)
MSEYIAQMAPMLGIAGAVVAWLGQIPNSRAGHGFPADMALGLAGSIVAGVSAAGITNFTSPPAVGMAAMAAVGMVGAVVGIAVQRAVWPSHTSRPYSRKAA